MNTGRHVSCQPNIALQVEGARVTSYRDLVVSARAVDLVVVCYQLSRQIPQSELYGLTSQIRRAVVSIPANIAEGHGRKTLGDSIQHLSIANGSLKELETHLLIAGRLHYVKDDEIDPALAGCSEIGQMLSGLIQRLRQKRL
jgi:four helix bundle protein